jgi:hypothetical protein
MHPRSVTSSGDAGGVNRSRQVGGQRKSTLVDRASVVEAIERAQQLGAGGVVQVVAVERVAELVELGQRRFRTVCVAQRDRAVQSGDR